MLHKELLQVLIGKVDAELLEAGGMQDDMACCSGPTLHSVPSKSCPSWCFQPPGWGETVKRTLGSSKGQRFAWVTQRAWGEARLEAGAQALSLCHLAPWETHESRVGSKETAKGLLKDWQSLMIQLSWMCFGGRGVGYLVQDRGL